MVSVFFSVLLGIAAVQAFPALVSRQSITSLAPFQVANFTPYTYFAKAAYCSPSTINSWNCGAACGNNTGFKPVASGGNGNSVQYWYVGYEPSLNTVILAHQGTNTSHIKALLTDSKLVMSGLNSSRFPGIPDHINVYDGVQDEQAETASDVLSAVKAVMSKYGTNSVTPVGHSFGAALALLDAVYLRLNLPSSTTIRTVLYGLPRVGNKAWADYVDSANLNVTHINNKKDPIPIVPGKDLGYSHCSGEVHITEDNQWMACPGQDNPSPQCIVGAVPNIFEGDEKDHDGSYDGIMMHCLD